MFKSKEKRGNMMKDQRQNNHLKYLYQAVLCLQTEDECARFFEDLCTGPELKAISQRLEVARLLNEEYVYNKIVEKTGASTATISRVNRSLQYGANGYDVIFERLSKKDDEL